MDYNIYVYEILGLFLILLAFIGYVVGSLLLKGRVRPVYVGVGSLIYCTVALLYYAWNSGKWLSSAPYESPLFWWSTWAAYWSLFTIPFMILTYAIGKYRLRHSKPGQPRDKETPNLS